MRIEFNNREKEFIHQYWYTVPEHIKTQLINKRRKTIDIEQNDIKELVGYLSLECNHCNSRQLAFELDDLRERLEGFINPSSYIM
ncbi:hypothetical protein BMR05_00115 [Methylococcaceae bacterium HT4]|nr:hypothetical protein BMR05_00115 [Methylococcaceae bacterium HT4]TXL21173.1 hypothetical protein BMR06_02130 [Methylococcaceae bacterium HT5]